MRYNLFNFYHSKEEYIKNAFRVCCGSKWVEAYLCDAHHGFTHGNQVRLGCLKLIEKLTNEEKEALIEEGKQIDNEKDFKSVIASVEIAALFHDCGRFNEDGEVILKEQGNHHIVGANRAKKFCLDQGFNKALPYIEDAILSHDYKDECFSPTMEAPKTMVGKIVQASDQMGWFHPESIYRTLKFASVLGRPFYSRELDIKRRLSWVPEVVVEDYDTITVFLHQLFGPCGVSRFGIKAAREKVETYKKDLKKNIIKEAKDQGVECQVRELIDEFSRRKQ